MGFSMPLFEREWRARASSMWLHAQQRGGGEGSLRAVTGPGCVAGAPPQVTATSLELHYYSARPGLWPIVVGVLKGVCKVGRLAGATCAAPRGCAGMGLTWPRCYGRVAMALAKALAEALGMALGS